jgi:hypothetical protein
MSETPPKVAPNCEAKHTTYNPTLEEWKCPKSSR